jgi:hypothetical protein
MLKTAAALAFVLVPALAHAQAQTETADTLVVVTPQAPTIVVTGGAAPAQSTAPGAVVAAPAAAVPAPQNEDWSNVSHINGHPVPVGERGAYLYKFKKTNIGVNAIGMMFGFYGVSLQQALSQNIAVRGDISAWSYDDGNHSGIEMSASLPIYFKRTYSGPFIEPGLIVHNDNHRDYLYDCYDCSGSDAMTTTSWVGPEMLIGWSTIFDSGLNMSYAVGAARRIGSDNSLSSSDEPELVSYFRVGYAF